MQITEGKRGSFQFLACFYFNKCQTFRWIVFYSVYEFIAKPTHTTVGMQEISSTLLRIAVYWTDVFSRNAVILKCQSKWKSVQCYHKTSQSSAVHVTTPKRSPAYLTGTYNPITLGSSSVWASFISPTPYVFLQSPLQPPVTTRACRLMGPAAGTAGSRVTMWCSSVIQATSCRVPKELSALRSAAVTSGSQTLPCAQVPAASLCASLYQARNDFALINITLYVILWQHISPL